MGTMLCRANGVVNYVLSEKPKCIIVSTINKNKQQNKAIEMIGAPSALETIDVFK